MSFYQEYKTLVEPLLGRTLTPADGCTVRSALRIPSALAEYYAAVGAIDLINCPHNRLLDPSVLQVEDGMVIFYEENQGVADWAIREVDLHLPDPTGLSGPKHDCRLGVVLRERDGFRMVSGYDLLADRQWGFSVCRLRCRP